MRVVLVAIAGVDSKQWGASAGLLRDRGIDQWPAVYVVNDHPMVHVESIELGEHGVTVAIRSGQIVTHRWFPWHRVIEWQAA